MSLTLPDLMTTIKAVDEASAVFDKVQAAAEESMGQVEEAGKKVELTHRKMTDGLKGVVTGFSGVATSAMALYGAYDRVQDMQVSVSRANLQVKTSLNSVEDAQRRLNAAIEKHGADSEQAVAAAKDLQLAQERYQVAVERSQMLQGNLNEAMVQSAISVIPTAITMINSLVTVKQSWAAAQAALNVVMNANPIMLIVTAVGLLIAAVATAYATCEPFRNAVNSLGATLMNVLKPAIDVVTGALDWLWKNVVEPFTGGLNALGNAVAGVANWFGSLFSQAGSASNQINSMSRDMKDLYGVVGHPPSTGLIESFEYLDKAMKSLETPEIVGPVAGEAAGLGIVAPAASPQVTVNINGPLVNVEGSADEAVLQVVTEKVRTELKTVVVEATTAAATTKRIRSSETLKPVVSTLTPSAAARSRMFPRIG